MFSFDFEEWANHKDDDDGIDGFNINAAPHNPPQRRRLHPRRRSSTTAASATRSPASRSRRSSSVHRRLANSSVDPFYSSSSSSPYTSDIEINDLSDEYESDDDAFVPRATRKDDHYVGSLGKPSCASYVRSYLTDPPPIPTSIDHEMHDNLGTNQNNFNDGAGGKQEERRSMEGLVQVDVVDVDQPKVLDVTTPTTSSFDPNHPFRVLSPVPESPGPKESDEGSKEFFVTDKKAADEKKTISKEDLELLRVIGKGAYGKVFLVRKKTGKDAQQLYAMKVIRKAHIVLHAKDTEHTKNERFILQSVRHPFIVRLFYAFQTNTKLYLILDYASGGELFTYLEKQKMLLESSAKFYLAELVCALAHLHKLGIIYRDLKPENVLLDIHGHVLLTDFGLSKVSLSDDASTEHTVCGTVEYMAPEVIANIPYDFSVDWWSLGALGFDMMTGQPPFTGQNKKKVMDQIMNKKLLLPYYLSPDAKDLLTRLMRKKASVRLGYGPSGDLSIRQHRFFQGLDWHALMNRHLTPPILPTLSTPEDVSNFHTDFTSMAVTDSPPDAGEDDIILTHGGRRPRPSKEHDELFQGFSFVASYVGPTHK